MAFDIEDLFVDVYDLPDDAYGFIQVIFLMFVYGLFLFWGSSLMTDGSLLLLHVPEFKDYLGMLILPILGVVPDIALVMFACTGSNGQYELEVAIGCLAGTAVMLVSLPWFMVLYLGRVQVKNDKLQYRQAEVDPPGGVALFSSGIAISYQLKVTTVFMLVSSLTYFIVEAPGIVLIGDADDEIAEEEKPYAYLACFVGYALFALYVIYNATYSLEATSGSLLDSHLASCLHNGEISIAAVVFGVMDDGMKHSEQDYGSVHLSEESADLVPSTTVDADRLTNILAPILRDFDTNNTGQLSREEAINVFKFLGITWVPDPKDMPGDSLSYAELSSVLLSYISQHSSLKIAALAEFARLEVEFDEDNIELSDDLLRLRGDEQQAAIKWRSFWMICAGLALVLLFSDPIVSCFQSIGDRTGVSSFYVSFILAPFASCLFEVVSAYKYAIKRTEHGVNVALSCLVGASVINNTAVLGSLCLAIAIQGFYFEYFAECLTVWIVVFLSTIMVLKGSKQLLVDGVMMLMLYPISIITFYLIEEYTIYE